MKKTIIIHDDFIEVLQDGYNIIDKTVYDDEVVALGRKLVKAINEE
jgi:hypothetical protein